MPVKGWHVEMDDELLSLSTNSIRFAKFYPQSFSIRDSDTLNYLIFFFLEGEERKGGREGG